MSREKTLKALGGQRVAEVRFFFGEKSQRSNNFYCESLADSFSFF